jgi:hypothetical protein
MIGALAAASLAITSPADRSSIPPGDISITFALRGAPRDAHLHVLLDKGPALEAPLAGTFVLKGVAAGPHLLRAVLCGRDHVSLKRRSTFALSRFWAGPRNADPVIAVAAERRAWPDQKRPLLTMVLPHGEGSEPPVLDLFVKGAALSRRGYRARVVVDRRELRLMTDAKPRKLKLKPGKHRITVDLLDRRGTKVAPIDRTDRTFTVR